MGFPSPLVATGTASPSSDLPSPPPLVGRVTRDVEGMETEPESGDEPVTPAREPPLVAGVAAGACGVVLARAGAAGAAGGGLALGVAAGGGRGGVGAGVAPDPHARSGDPTWPRSTPPGSGDARSLILRGVTRRPTQVYYRAGTEEPVRGGAAASSTSEGNCGTCGKDEGGRLWLRPHWLRSRSRESPRQRRSNPARVRRQASIAPALGRSRTSASP